MIFRSTTCLFLLAMTIGFALFQIKHQVIRIEKDLNVAMRDITNEEEAIHILKAEWSYLNEPSRLQALAEKYLDVKPVVADQMVSLAQGLDQAMDPGVLMTHSPQVHSPQTLQPTFVSWTGQ